VHTGDESTCIDVEKDGRNQRAWKIAVAVMMSTMQRQSSTQPAAAVAARDRATVELVLQKVHAHSCKQRVGAFCCVQDQLQIMLF